MFGGHWLAALRFKLAKGGLDPEVFGRGRRRTRRLGLAISRVERLEDRTLLAAPIALTDTYVVVHDSLSTTAEGKPSGLARFAGVLLKG